MKKSIGSNTVLYPTPVIIVGSYDEQNTPNAMAVAWGGVVSSDPACVSVSIRSSRKTYENIMKKNAFTVNIPSAKYVKEADYFGIETGKNVNKFDKTGLTAEKAEYVEAPYIKEFPLVLECEVLKTVEIGVHTQFIGKIIDIKIDETCLDNDGKPILNQIDPLAYAVVEKGYYKIGERVGDAYKLGIEYK